MNIGKAVSVQDDDADQIVVIITSPTGRVVNSSIPTHATPIRARPTQTPVPNKVKRTKRKRIMTDIFSMLLLSVALIGQITGDAMITLEQDVEQVIGERDGENDGSDQHG